MDDESYWKEDDGALLQEWALRSQTVTDDPEPPDTLDTCSHCDSEVEQVGITEHKKLPVWLCPTCDGSALEIARSQPS